MSPDKWRVNNDMTVSIDDKVVKKSDVRDILRLIHQNSHTAANAAGFRATLNLLNPGASNATQKLEDIVDLVD